MSEFKRISNVQLYRWKFWFWLERKSRSRLGRVSREIDTIKIHNTKVFADKSVSE